MSRQLHSLALAIIVAAGGGAVAGALAADAGDGARRQTHKHSKKIRMNEPMTSKMMKPGMMKGDVKKAADRTAKEMRPMMEQEEKAMPQDGASR